jgi:hypothetical protein
MLYTVVVPLILGIAKITMEARTKAATGGYQDLTHILLHLACMKHVS